MWTKLAAGLLLPPAGNLLLMLLGLLLLWRGRKRTGAVLLVFGLATLWSLATPWVATGLIEGLERQIPALPLEQVPSAEAIVVLGGGLSPAAPPRQTAELNEGSDRVLYAARLYRAGKAPLVLVAGGYPSWYGDVPSEAQSTRELLVFWGVPDEAIVAEEQSLNTYENAVETRRALEARGVTQVLLVTSALHMPRTLATFERAGLRVTPIPTDFLSTDAGETTALDFVPSAAALDASRRALHEHLGLLYYRMRGFAE